MNKSALKLSVAGPATLLPANQKPFQRIDARCWELLCDTGPISLTPPSCAMLQLLGLERTLPFFGTSSDHYMMERSFGAMLRFF